MLRIVGCGVVVAFMLVAYPATTFAMPLDLRPIDKNKPCTTLEGKFFTLTQSDLDLALNMASQDDNEALKKMNKEGRVFSSNKGIVVFIEDETEDFYKLRPKGRTVHIWMRKKDLACQKVPRN